MLVLHISYIVKRRGNQWHWQTLQLNLKTIIECHPPSKPLPPEDSETLGVGYIRKVLPEVRREIIILFPLVHLTTRIFYVYACDTSNY